MADRKGHKAAWDKQLSLWYDDADDGPLLTAPVFRSSGATSSVAGFAEAVRHNLPVDQAFADTQVVHIPSPEAAAFQHSPSVLELDNLAEVLHVYDETLANATTTTVTGSVARGHDIVEVASDDGSVATTVADNADAAVPATLTAARLECNDVVEDHYGFLERHRTETFNDAMRTTNLLLTHSDAVTSGVEQSNHVQCAVSTALKRTVDVDTNVAITDSDVALMTAYDNERPSGLAPVQAATAASSSDVHLGAMVERSKGTKRRFPQSYSAEPCAAFFVERVATKGRMAGQIRIERCDSVEDELYDGSCVHKTSVSRKMLDPSAMVYAIPYTLDGAAKFDEALLGDGIKYMFLPNNDARLRSETEGIALQRCKRAVRELQATHYDLKIGITGNPLERIWFYKNVDGLDSLYILHSSWEKGVVGMLEAALIDIFESTGLHNEQRGGDGNSKGVTGIAGPWWCYAAVGKPYAFD
jgi:hypothetical protein